MQFPQRFSDLPAYAFPRLRALLDQHAPGGDVLHMSIGEPKHPFPPFVAEIIQRNAADFGKYPPNPGDEDLLAATAEWISTRYGLSLDPSLNFLALNGTREGLFNAVLALCPEKKNGQRPIVLMPNPFYQVYAVGAIEARADPVMLPATAETGYLPDFDAVPDDVLSRTSIAFVCSPSNPQGAVATSAYWQNLLDLAEKHDFRIFADECYSEIYRDEQPPGVLETNADPERIVAFHSLSKRSNLPGLRSGFAASGPKNIAAMKKLREYAGAPMPLPLQSAAAAAWRDEEHVNENRALYRAKYDIADQIFGDVDEYQSPNAGFFIWMPVSDGEQAALKIWKETGVRVLPGAYLSRPVDGRDPGSGYIRIAMVAPIDEFRHGLKLVRQCL